MNNCPQILRLPNTREVGILTVKNLPVLYKNASFQTKLLMVLPQYRGIQKHQQQLRRWLFLSGDILLVSCLMFTFVSRSICIGQLIN